MDKLLLADNLDMRLTTYKVLATGVDSGFVQFVDSTPLRDVMSEFGSILVRYNVRAT
jgi:phosphatidylinositol 3-kinase